MKNKRPKPEGKELGLFMNFMTDFAFKKILRNEKFLIDFLNEILEKESKVNRLEYLDSEQLGRAEKDRKAVYDIYCKNERDECLILEMQVAYQKYYFDRMLFYATFPIQKQAVKGDWDYELKPVYCISIVDFEIIGRGSHINHVDFIWRETIEKATEKLNFIIIELPKFKKTLRQLKTRLDWWVYCIKHLGKLTKQPAELHDPVFDELFETARINNLKDEYMKRTYNKSILEYEDVRVCMRDIGELNLEKGKLAKTNEIAKNGLRNGFSIDQISLLTGLTPSQINQLH